MIYDEDSKLPIYDELTDKPMQESPDLTIGYLYDSTIIRPGAEPVEGVWQEGDILPVKKYCRWSESQLEAIRMQPIYELQEKLQETDYIAAKIMDKLVLCSTPEEMAETANHYQDKYSKIFEQRQEWRNEINKLRDGI